MQPHRNFEGRGGYLLRRGSWRCLSLLLSNTRRHYGGLSHWCEKGYQSLLLNGNVFWDCKCNYSISNATSFYVSCYRQEIIILNQLWGSLSKLEFILTVRHLKNTAKSRTRLVAMQRYHWLFRVTSIWLYHHLDNHVWAIYNFFRRIRCRNCVQNSLKL